MPHTSFSEIRLARKCAKAWAYKYVEKIVPRRPKRPALIGTILHDMLDAWVKAKLFLEHDLADHDPWKVHEKYVKQYAKLFKEEREEFGDVPETAATIFEGYLRRWREDGLTYEQSEAPVLTDLTGDIRLIGYIDKIARDKAGRRFLMDHKFHRVLPGPEDRFADIQTVLYFWAWNRQAPKDQQLDGIIWDYGRMKAPTKPELLKNGRELTRRANIDTDPYTYLQTIKEHGFNPKDYRDILKHLDGKERTFFDRVILPSPPKNLIETVVEDVRAEAVIRKSLGAIAPRAMSGFNCKTCDYRTLCEAEVRGQDADFVRKRHYEPRESHGDFDGIEDFE